MNITYMSDLHLEFGQSFIWPKNKDNVLVLAGDIGIHGRESTYIEFLYHCSENYREVIYIPGNHEYYYNYFPNSIQETVESLNMLKNVTYGDLFVKEIDDVVFICGTMWTSFEGDKTIDLGINKKNAMYAMNDYRYIKYDGGPLHVNDISKHFDKSEKYFYEQIKKYKYKKVVMVTHHAPHEKSLEQSFYCDQAYFNNMEHLILEYKPKIWIHGHIHKSNKYNISDTCIVSNPRGYEGRKLNHNFNPYTEIEI